MTNKIKIFLAFGLLSLALLVITAGPAAAQCTSDADCTNPAFPKCTDSTCQAVPGNCQSDADCNDPTTPICDNGTCVPGCTIDSDCTNPAKPKCLSGSCQVLPGACTTDAECTEPTNPSCQNSVCSPAPPLPCLIDADCANHPLNQFCDIDSLVCVASLPEPQFDHLRCYKMKDSLADRALINMVTDPNHDLFPDEAGCKVIVKSKEYCVPVAKRRILQPSSKKDAVHLTVPGQRLTSAMLCYKVKCPTDAQSMPSALSVEDQFGDRVVSKFVTSKLCTPAYSTAAPQYKDPAIITVLSGQTVNPAQGGAPIVAAIRVTTNAEPEFFLPSLVSVVSPAGLPSFILGEDFGTRSCPGGTPSLAPTSGAGCVQNWEFEILPDPGLCEIDGDYTLTWNVGCNPNMPHCDYVDPAQADHVVVITLDSADFCPQSTTTTTTSSTTSTTSGGGEPMCPLDSEHVCFEAQVATCASCCNDFSPCVAACGAAASEDCTDSVNNTACANELNIAGCAEFCPETCN